MWGTAVFDEHVEHGLFLLLAIMSAGVLAAGAIALARSPLLEDETIEADERRG